MKKRLVRSFALALALALTLPFALAMGAGPEAPAWCPAEEYVIFEGSAAYQGETWETILMLRQHAQAGNLPPTSGGETVLFNRLRELRHSDDPGVQFELGLAAVQFAANALARGEKPAGSTAFEMAAVHAAPYAAEQPEAVYLARLWNARMALLSGDLAAGLEGKDLGFFVGAVEPLLAYGEFTMEALYGCPLAKSLPAEQLAAAKSLIFVTLDGAVVHPRAVRVSTDYLDTTVAHSKNNRTMVPVRRLAELMGATVDYDAATRQITIRRAQDTIVMTLDSDQALQNGVPFQMDVAPYAENNRTYIPIRYIAEFFGQKVDWAGPQQHVVITEDKAAAGNSNLERWALGMGLLLHYENNPQEAHLFGGKTRFGAGPVGSGVSNRLMTTGADFGRQTLAQSWNIRDREGLLSMTAGLAGEKNAWNLFRVSHLAQWGYLAGYVTYPEALELVEPAAKALAANYSSWEAAYADYLAGGPNKDSRTQLLAELRADPALAALLDDSLFQAGVTGLPG